MLIEHSHVIKIETTFMPILYCVYNEIHLVRFGSDVIDNIIHLRIRKKMLKWLNKMNGWNMNMNMSIITYNFIKWIRFLHTMAPIL